MTYQRFNIELREEDTDLYHEIKAFMEICTEELEKPFTRPMMLRELWVSYKTVNPDTYAAIKRRLAKKK